MANTRKAEEAAPVTVMDGGVGDVKYVKVTAPSGAVTSVPEGVVEALRESGYTTGK